MANSRAPRRAVLAVTHVFERRVAKQYAIHARAPGVGPLVKSTLKAILRDERWHIRWVRDALRRMTNEYDGAQVRAALERYENADRQVFQSTIAEHSALLGPLGLPLSTEGR